MFSFPPLRLSLREVSAATVTTFPKNVTTSVTTSTSKIARFCRDCYDVATFHGDGDVLVQRFNDSTIQWFSVQRRACEVLMLSIGIQCSMFDVQCSMFSFSVLYYPSS